MISNFNIENYGEVASFCLISHLVSLVAIQFMLDKMRGDTAKEAYIPKNVFSINIIERAKLYGFICWSPRIKGIS